jgi:rhodanese-related sulfurtransferase
VRFRHYLKRATGVSAAEAMELVAEGALVVDVRREWEWRRQRIPGALFLPLERLPAEAIDLPEDRVLITFCTGGLRSAGAANLLVEYGFEALNMTGGLIDWKRAGGALEGIKVEA